MHIANTIRCSIAFLVVATCLASDASAFQSPLAPLPISANKTVSIENREASRPPAEVFSFSKDKSSVRPPRTAKLPESINVEPDAGAESKPDSSDANEMIAQQLDALTTPDSLPSSLKLAVVLGVLSLAPAIILMSTCYVRLIVVLTLLRQAFGVQQLPPTQVLTALSLFVTLLVMAPVWNEVKTEAIDPYTRAESPIEWEEAWKSGVAPVKRFMLKQIRIARNENSIAVFYKNLPQPSSSTPVQAPENLEDIPINILLPAFLISELKVAFLLGFQIYLPFLILDLVVSSVTVSMGMVMLPPTMVSFPLKLILFVMVDGWNLVLGMLLQSFG